MRAQRVSMPKHARQHLCVWRKAAISLVAIVSHSPLSFAAIGGEFHRVTSGIGCVVLPEGVLMPMSRKDARGGGSIAIPVFGIVLLLACYWILADWQDLHALIGSALTALHWPH